MYCPNCGAKVADNARFCPNCGTSLAAAAASVAPMPSPEPAKDLSQAAPAPVQEPVSYAAPVQQPVSYGAPQQQSASPFQPGQNPPPASLVGNPGTASGYEPPKSAEVPDYSYPQGSAAVPGYDAGNDPYYYAPAEPPKRKGRVWLAIVAVLLILVMLAGLFASLIRAGRSDRKFDQYVQEAQTAYASEDYSKAIEMYEKALELKPDDKQVREKLGDLYNHLFFGLVTTGDYPAAIDALENAERFGSISKEDAAELFGAAYGLWITELLDAGDYETCAVVLEEAKPYISESEYDTFVSWLEIDQSMSSPDNAVTAPAGPDDASVPGIKSLALWIASSVDKNAPFELCEDLHEHDEMVSEALEGRPQLTVPVTGCGFGYVVFYADDGFSGRYYVYYGGLNADGERDGEGWILSRPDYEGPNVYLFKATWENGKANGPFGEIAAYGEDLNDIRVYTGSLKDGYYDGEIQIFWPSEEKTFFAVYDEGIPTVLGTDENGKDIIAYTEDHESWLWIEPGTAGSERVGVERM